MNNTKIVTVIIIVVVINLEIVIGPTSISHFYIVTNFQPRALVPVYHLAWFKQRQPGKMMVVVVMLVVVLIKVVVIVVMMMVVMMLVVVLMMKIIVNWTVSTEAAQRIAPMCSNT